MKNRQELVLLGKTYATAESNMHFSTDRETFEKTYTAKCCIAAEDIVAISPWVMQGKDKIEVTFRNIWCNEKKVVTDIVDYTFHNAICTDFWEAYNSERDTIYLWFCMTAESVTRIDAAEVKALKNLIE